MDPVSLTLGVVPLVGGAIKTYKTIHKKLKTFCHYSREVKQVQKLLDRQSHFFLNEVHLLLREVLDDEEAIRLMLKDVQYSKWQSNDLEVEMRTMLEQNYDVCRGVIEEAGSTMKSLQDELRCFDELAAECRRDEPLKDAIRRLRGRIKITWNKTKLEKLIDELRVSNGDLQRLREQACELNKPKGNAIAIQRQRKQVDQEYSQLGTIRSASKALHEALTCAWSAKSTAEADVEEQLRHTVRLFLETKVQDDVSMELVICCFGHGFANSRFTQESLTRLHVRSQLRAWVESQVQPSTDTTSSDQANENPRKRRRVRFMPDEKDDPPPTNSRNTSQVDLLQVNLPTEVQPGGLCSTLCKASPKLAAKSSSPIPCLGYVDSHSPMTFRHSFYRPPDDNGTESRSAMALRGITSLSEMLSHPIESSLTIVDQLKLARNLASAALKFYSTPWLNEYFSLCDLFFFRMSRDLSRCLRTLHVGLEFTQLPCSHPLESMEGVVSTGHSKDAKGKQLAKAAEDAKLLYGVRNLTLWSLGTVLLQIGRWSAIAAPDDVIGVRRLSAQIPSLGPKYRDLTRKCLECDFGYGDDLSKPRLQQAVHESLICELNDMIKCLDISNEDEGEL